MTKFLTPAGVTVERTVAELDDPDLTPIVAQVESRRGGVLSSGMEYPGRYSRYHLAYVDPSLEVVARGRSVSVRQLNARGFLLVDVLAEALEAAGVGAVERSDGEVRVEVPTPTARVPEELRSKLPTAFSALRVVLDALKCDDPYLGLWGAFGYDLAYQFEPIPFAKDRAADAARPGAAPGRRDLRGRPQARDRAGAPLRVQPRRPDHEGAAARDGVAGLCAVRVGPGRAGAGRVRRHGPPRQARSSSAGDLFEVVPGQSFYEPCGVAPGVLRRLRDGNPAPYEFLINLGDGEYLVGASPEMFVRVDGRPGRDLPDLGDDRARARPDASDAAQIATLLDSAKDESELTMCTDVDRNDKSRVCVPGR